jgi:hypothetical protein
MIKELNIKEEEVYDMNYLHALNWLSYWYQIDEIERRKNKNII